MARIVDWSSATPLPPDRPTPGDGTRKDCATIAVVALALAGVLRPFQDTPFIDDWVYSWSVQHLLETREFLFPELVGNPIAAQVLWGALFCLPFGFSLAALRVSTWVLGVLAVCALYLLVRECGGTRRAALTAAAVLGFYPVFFILSPTFMTDVPFLAAMLWSVLLFVRALHRRRVSLVWLAAAVCAASVGSRAIGVGIAGAMIATLLFHTGHWGRRIHVWLAPALVGPFALWLLVWTRARVFTSADITWLPNGPQRRMANLRSAFGPDILPSMLVVTLLFALVLVGIALLPIAVGLVRRAIVRRMAYVLALFAAAWIIARRAGLNAWVPFEPGIHLGPARDRRRGVIRAGMAGRPASVVGGRIRRGGGAGFNRDPRRRMAPRRAARGREIPPVDHRRPGALRRGAVAHRRSVCARVRATGRGSRPCAPAAPAYRAGRCLHCRVRGDHTGGRARSPRLQPCGVGRRRRSACQGCPAAGY